MMDTWGNLSGKYVYVDRINNVFSKINILIDVFNFLETVYVGLQMLRMQNINCKVILYICDPSVSGDPRLADLSNLGNVSIEFSGNNFRDMKGVHANISDCFNMYNNKYDTSPYILFTFQDHWILKIEKLTALLKYMISNKYDGFNFDTSVGNHIVLGTAFYVVKPELLKAVTSNDRFRVPGITWEHLFEDVARGWNWYIANSNTLLWHQYGYNAEIGVAHVHAGNEKLYFIKLWEERYGKKLDYNGGRLNGEQSRNYDIGRWPFNSLPSNLDISSCIITKDLLHVAPGVGVVR